jgi:predicted transglutaminase-like cysteine proteinase
MMAAARTATIALATAATTLLATVATQASSAMQTGEVTSQPIGHYEFCLARPAECAIRPINRAPLRLHDSLWNRIVTVNLAVNRSVEPMNDIDIYGKDEVWTYPAGAGDCEDYVLEKRRRLMAEGISPADLLITVVRKWNGEGHAVLTVRTDRGDYILDNLRDDVRPWTATGYRYLKRQATFNTGRWVTINAPDEIYVGSTGSN